MSPSVSSDKKLDTSLAGEFFVMHALHRLGVRPNLMLGNSKGIDIVARLQGGRTVEVEVKSLRTRDEWLIGGEPPSRTDLFWCFVSFNGRMDNPCELPKVWVIPSHCLRCGLCYSDSAGNWGVKPKVLERHGVAYAQADGWQLFRDKDAGKPRTADALRLWRSASPPDAESFYSAAYLDNWVLPGFDCSAEGCVAVVRQALETPDSIPAMNTDGVAQVVTAIFRKERFWSGTLESHMEVLQRLSDRVIADCGA